MHRDHELHKRRRSRNLGLLAIALFMVVLLFLVTIVKLGPNAANPWG